MRQPKAQSTQDAGCDARANWNVFPLMLLVSPFTSTGPICLRCASRPASCVDWAQAFYALDSSRQKSHSLESAECGASALFSVVLSWCQNQRLNVCPRHTPQIWLVPQFGTICVDAIVSRLNKNRNSFRNQKKELVKNMINIPHTLENPAHT